MHYYPFHLKDYLVETAHLPPMADLAYRRLIDLYYKTESPIKNEPKWVANRIRLDGEEKVIGFVLREYFTFDKDSDPPVWRHKTCDEVIAKYQKKAAVARENGLQHKAGTEKKPKSDADRKLTKNHKPRTNKSPLPPEGEVWWEEFWKVYPRKEKKPHARTAYAKALAKAPAEAIMAGLQRYLPCDQWRDPTKIPHPATWLNAEQWNDTPAKAPDASQADDPKAWWMTKTGIVNKALELRLPGPPEETEGPGRWFAWVASVWLAAGDGPWINDKDEHVYPRFVRLRNGS